MDSCEQMEGYLQSAQDVQGPGQGAHETHEVREDMRHIQGWLQPAGMTQHPLGHRGVLG
jgi:hypothetical protein